MKGKERLLFTEKSVEISDFRFLTQHFTALESQNQWMKSQKHSSETPVRGL